VLRRAGYGRIDWHEAVDFTFTSIELNERPCGIVVSVLEELVERRRDLAVDTGRFTDEPEPQVAPAWDRRLVETQRVLDIAWQALGAKPIRASSIVDQAHHPTRVQRVEPRLEVGPRFLNRDEIQWHFPAKGSGVVARDVRDPSQSPRYARHRLSVKESTHRASEGLTPFYARSAARFELESLAHESLLDVHAFGRRQLRNGLN
jgi:hypothetical protein